MKRGGRGKARNGGFHHQPKDMTYDERDAVVLRDSIQLSNAEWNAFVAEEEMLGRKMFEAYSCMTKPKPVCP